MTENAFETLSRCVTLLLPGRVFHGANESQWIRAKDISASDRKTLYILQIINA